MQSEGPPARVWGAAFRHCRSDGSHPLGGATQRWQGVAPARAETCGRIAMRVLRKPRACPRQGLLGTPEAGTESHGRDPWCPPFCWFSLFFFSERCSPGAEPPRPAQHLLLRWLLPGLGVATCRGTPTQTGLLRPTAQAPEMSKLKLCPLSRNLDITTLGKNYIVTK